jgi:ferredoxin, 2Fe-2S
MSDDDIRKLVVIDMAGARHEVDGLDGWRVMEIIRDNGLPIKAECGGACACATCHVYVDDAWRGKLVAPSDEEIERLDEAFEVTERSRLSCQILMREDLDGLIVTLAPGSEP